MGKNYTTTIQEVRRDPVGLLRQVNEEKIVTVIYKSKPFSEVMSAKKQNTNGPTNVQKMLEYAELARNSAKAPIDVSMNYKEAHRQDMAKKYDIS